MCPMLCILLTLVDARFLWTGCVRQHQVVRIHGARSKTARVLVDTATCTLKASLIVVGCRARSTLKRALIGSVSARVAALSSCPVMVVKKPRSEAGAFLTVLPRRVCIHVDGTKHSSAAFRWAMTYLLNSDVDEVSLMCCRLQTSKAFSWLTRSKASEEEARNIEICEQLCIQRGFHVVRVDVSAASPRDARPERSPSAAPSTSSVSSAPAAAAAAAPRLSPASSDELIRASLQENCDLLLVSRECKGGTIPQQAPFPVVVLGAQKSGDGDAVDDGGLHQKISPTELSQVPSFHLYIACIQDDIHIAHLTYLI